MDFIDQTGTPMTSDAELIRLANSVLWPGFLGDTVPAWLHDALSDGLAGVVLFAQNLTGDTAALAHSIHAAGPLALIGIDEEGGSVTRLETAGGSTLPGALQLGILDDEAATYATGVEIGRRCALLDLDVVIGPVADVNTDPRNPVIGVRAFGAETDLVARHTAAEVQGIQSVGVAACVKHYPGHGDTHVDSHHGLPQLTIDDAEIDAVHLPPFRAAIAAGAMSVMTAHISAPQWGTSPATLNALVLGRLRTEGFDGVIITDALDMAAIRETVGIGGGAVQALAAGADLLCIGNPTNPGDAMLPDQDERDYRAARDAIVEALRDASLDIERVREAAGRVHVMAERVRSRPAPAAEPAADYDAAALAAEAIRVRGGALRSFDDAPTLVLDLRGRSTFAVDSGASHVALTLAAGGEIVAVDPEVAEAVAAAASRASAERAVLLVDRLDDASPQSGAAAAIAIAAPQSVIVNVGVPSGAPSATVIDAGAASLLAARAARDRLVGAAR